MLKANEQITLSWDEAISILEELELLVVSLDKIGSYYIYTDTDEGNFQKELARFFVDWKVLRRLAKARGILTEKFDTTLGDDDMDDIEREMERIKYWEAPGDKPNDFVE